MEIWKDIKDYEGLYQVSNKGRIKSLNYNHTKKEKVLKVQFDTQKYLQVKLRKNGKQKSFRVHKLVAQAFVPNPDGLNRVVHKDGNKINNCAENLEFVNSYRKIKCIETGEIFNSLKEASITYNISNASISLVCNKKRKSAGGYHWQYV